ncbi:MAG: hypothetical protein JNM14_02610 [Ferruginibacter sp.]|nr:hypothetical protein [Ferruginibacter sp.]
MITRKIYKSFAGAILLALYVFITVPAQLWHHHTYTAKSGTSTQKKGIVSFSKADGSISETDCGVCSHKYSTYSSDAAPLFEAPQFSTTAKNGFCYHTIPSSPSCSFFNRGPPALV